MTGQTPDSRAAAWDRAILLGLAVAWVFAMACIAVGGHDFNSDGATAPLQANDILHGNVFLSGWSAPMDQFYTLDIALNTVLTAGVGLTPASLAMQSFLVLLVVASAVFFLARRPGAAGWVTAAALIIFLGWPTQFQRRIVFSVILHIPTLACALLGLLGLNGLYMSTNGGRWKYGWLVYGVTLFLAAAADPFIWFIAGAPFLIAGAVVAWRGRDWRPWRQALIVALGAGLAAKALVLILQHQGFQILSLRSSYRDYVVSWNQLPHNLYLDGRSWLILFGWPTIEANPEWLLSFGRSMTGLSPFEEFLAVGRILVAVWAVVVTLVAVLKPASEPAKYYVDYALLLGILFNHASFITSIMPVDDRSAHYLFPAFVYMVILAARRISPFFSEKLARAPGWVRPLVLTALVGLLTPAILWLWALGQARVNVGDRELADWMQRRKLHLGYADYWQANIITLLTKEKVQVAQTVVSPTGRIAPEHWNSKADWYKTPANFYICLPDDKYFRAALATFGRPSEINQVGQYRVMIWDHDIQPALHDYTMPINPTDLPIEAAALWQSASPGVKMNELGQWVDDQPREKAAIIIYGPYAKLPAGRYRVQFGLTDAGAAPGDTVICEATIRKGDVVLNQKTLTGADFAGAGTKQAVNLVITSPGPDEPVEFRVWKSGKGKLTLLNLTLDKD